MNESQHAAITICSDSIGETAEAVVRATVRQFDARHIAVKRVGYVKHEDQIRLLMEEAAEDGGFVAYTLVQPELREAIRAESIRLGVRAVDIMGPMMQAFVDTFHDVPKSRPGLLRLLDDDYYRRVEAIEFAVKCDDGRDAGALLKADLVLIGVSRTSKTPLSIFLAHTGLKVANFPVVPEVKPPDVLQRIPPARIVGLTIAAEQLLGIREERLKAIGLPPGSRYATLERIYEELEHTGELFRKLGCVVIDVTNKAIEETAAIIKSYL